MKRFVIQYLDDERDHDTTIVNAESAEAVLASWSKTSPLYEILRIDEIARSWVLEKRLILVEQK